MPSNRRHDSCTKYRLQQQLPLRLVLPLLLALPLPSLLLLCVLRHFFFAFYHNLFDTRQARFAFAFVATLVASMSHRRHLCVNCTRAFPVHRLCNLCCKNNHNFFFAIQISTHTPLESGSCYVAFECNTVMKKATINNRDIRDMRYEYVKGVSHSRIVMQANISISHTSVKFEIKWIV